ncbi:MAG: zinc-binding dehydrogenase [Chloroflexi bacterium]|nr:zinc-binding dehydrogenase [Chloroflexota bacterium]
MTGRRLVFRSDRKVELEEYPIPEPGPNQVLVRVTHSYVSAGSETRFYRVNPPDGPLKRSTAGYMAVGRVEKPGPGVVGFEPGDRVLTCGYHGTHWLVDLADTGPGKWYIEKLDDAVPDRVAGFTILGEVALHSLRRATLQLDESVAVFGVGIVGQLTVQLARVAGAYPIIAVDLFDSRLQKAKLSGATHFVNASLSDPVAAVRAITGGAGADAVFHCAPVASTLQTVLEAAAERGKAVLTALVAGTAEIELANALLRSERTIVAAYPMGLTQPHPYWPWTRQRNRRTCLRLLKSGDLRLDHLVTHVVPYTQAQEMVDLMVRGGDEWMGIVFTWP